METWKRSQNMQVVTLNEGAIVGRLDDFHFDLESHRIDGWRLKGVGMFAKAGLFEARRLRQIGEDVAFIESEVDIVWNHRRQDVNGRAWASVYSGMAVISRRGSIMGAVKDFVIDVQEDVVTGLILHKNRLLVLSADVQTGTDVIIARSSELLVELPEEEQRGPWWARIRDALRARSAQQQIETVNTPEEDT